MNRFDIAAVAVAALGVASIAVIGAMHPEPSYRLDSSRMIGREVHVYALDSGMTLRECRLAAPGEPMAVCVREGDNAGPRPVLVGYGCDGASGPIMATEESDFPDCDRIESHGANWSEVAAREDAPDAP